WTRTITTRWSRWETAATHRFSSLASAWRQGWRPLDLRPISGLRATIRTGTRASRKWRRSLLPPLLRHRSRRPKQAVLPPPWRVAPWWVSPAGFKGRSRTLVQIAEELARTLGAANHGCIIPWDAADQPR